MTLTAESRALDLAQDYLEAIRAGSLDAPGVTRASYGPGERLAHARAREAAEELGLEVRVDPIGTLFMTLPGEDRSLPAGMIGSHADSVPHGGNFDGAAGVAMGLAVAARLRHLGRRLPRDLTVLAIRAEEMVWFPANYLGSRAAFGILPREAPDTLRRSDTGRTLADHMAEEGFDPDFIRAGRASLAAERIAWFLEPHIEQGPELVEAGIPAAIVTGIRGSLRHRNCRAIGQDAHAGGAPRRSRRDAVIAAARLVAGLDAFWTAEEAAGTDLVCTIGEFFTDATRHAPTRVPGEVRFTLDIRSEDVAALARAEAWLAEAAAQAKARHGVTVDYGPALHVAPALMDARLRAALAEAAAAAGIPVLQMASGGGHDCATFAGQGIASAMLFIRNDGGSHNPQEAMEMGDFAAAFRIAAGAVKRFG
ncbi:hydantoinase/carbamoylase family amidase [Falsiroseomonas tokyonensis]|uniref:Hydantoinase/carbamoylase family amidase n=1 Tax=Falsiroseomonas tokyonensis TaxID=430521 RepID=A0ABV7BWC0_9PROT|nr:hydantoinase/carbamoylase family amidase [Falsiroseomonas tokyonensis]MBU8539174.1 hydantoinase/carbamoylase family amidase [Falsiroseomonas tokyonensis]